MSQLKKIISQAGKEEPALALLLWKDFKCQGKLDIQVTKQALELAKELGVEEEFDKISSMLPPMRIEPRYPN
jgi:hypothetical protein